MADERLDAAGGARPPGRLARRIGAVSLISIVIGIGIVAAVVAPGPASNATRQSFVPSMPPETARPAEAESFEDRRLTFEGLGLTLIVPWNWAAVSHVAEMVAHVADPRSQASLAVTHTGPREAVVCDPACTTIDLPLFLPFQPERTLDALANAITKQTGVQDWVAIDPERIHVNDARLLAMPAVDGAAVQRTYVIGHYANGLVVAVAAVPVGIDSDGLLPRLLEGIRPFPAETFEVGAPVTWTNARLGFAIDVPDIWSLDRSRLAARTLTFGDGAVRVSVADAKGVLTVCDPTCRVVVADDLRELEREAFGPRRAGIELGDATLSGARARYRLDRTTVSPSYQVIAIVDGRPVQVWLDRADPGVDASVIEQIVASFRYLPPTANRTVDGVLVGPGFKLPLPDGWDTGRPRSPTVTVSVGNDAGQVWTCRWSGWGTRTVPCAIEQGTTLHELIRGTSARAWGQTKEDELDGEPAIVVSRIATYEYPARGAQYLAYVFAVHDGRPYVIRLWNPADTGLPVQEVIDGFRFTE